MGKIMNCGKKFTSEKQQTLTYENKQNVEGNPIGKKICM